MVAHNNPDPDAIATGWALCKLIGERLGKPGRVIAGGAVSRAENRRMIQLLKPPLDIVDNLETNPDDAIVLVDCNPLANNHLLQNTSIRPVAVIDHHGPELGSFRVPFRDLRPRTAASATIAAQYIREQQVEPGSDLATAMIYALRTDTRTEQPTLSRLDKSAIAWLTPKADHEKLAGIENAPLPRSYYADMLLAMENTFIHDGAALCFLPQASGPETVAEIADLLVRCEGIHRVLCVAMVEGDVYLSARSSPRGGDANAALQAVLKGLGRGGGHRHRAGGKVPAAACDGIAGPDLHNELRNRWLAACKIEQQRGTRLVPRREILEHL
ncbi:MAG: hypothetical protein GXY44_06415 [Phycisphaerales bacterium]|nr:hypothetical protein [Phycisphaerales bacterium]